MKKVEDRQQLLGVLSEIRNNSQSFITNFFWDEGKHQLWINDGSLFYKIGSPECVLLIHNEGQFARLFYAAANLESLSHAIGAFRFDGILSIDIVTKEEVPSELNVFLNNGYDNRRHLFRMVRIGKFNAKNIDDKNIETATLQDVESVHDLLMQSFDPLSEQIPSETELQSFIANKGILLYKEKERIIGLLIYQVIGVNWYLRYWLIIPQYRGLHVGSKMFNYALSKHTSSKRQMLWVVADNENAIEKYTHYGFKRDRLNDYVITKGTII